jgi:hypothetical protein
MPLPTLQLRRAAPIRAALLGAAALLTLAACESATAPRCPLAGDWAWVGNNNPGGSSLDLSLSTAGDAVTGTGVAYGVGPSATADSISASGVYLSRSGNLCLTLSYRSGRVVKYSATLSCPDRLDGTATAGGDPYALGFRRSVAP